MMRREAGVRVDALKCEWIDGRGKRVGFEG